MARQAHRIESRSAPGDSRPLDALPLARLLRRTVLGPEEQHLGHVRDVVVRPGEDAHPPVTGIVAHLGTYEVFLPATVLTCQHRCRVQLAAVTELRGFARRDGDLLLGTDVLGRRLITSLHLHPVRAHDLLLSRSTDGWVLSAVHVRGRGRRWLRTGQHDGLLDWQAVRGNAVSRSTVGTPLPS